MTELRWAARNHRLPMDRADGCNRAIPSESAVLASAILKVVLETERTNSWNYSKPAHSAMLGDMPLWFGTADPPRASHLMRASERTCLQFLHVGLQKEAKGIQSLSGWLEIDVVQSVSIKRAVVVEELLSRASMDRAFSRARN